jgi:hypothetical protein
MKPGNIKVLLGRLSAATAILMKQVVPPKHAVFIKRCLVVFGY